MTNQVNEEIATKIGVAIGKMHDAEVVHGDLTTSNLMLQYNSSGDLEIVIIDFGLASMKPVIEDMAVDLYVLERAFISTHPGSEQLVSAQLSYTSYSINFSLPTVMCRCQRCLILIAFRVEKEH